jgi:hypothetical protein
MYFADLTPYEYDGTEPQPTILNVGWLSKDQPFPLGAVSGQFITALQRLTAQPVNLYRGPHLCEFCPRPPTELSPGGFLRIDPDPETCGNGEIRVSDKHGYTYVAPTLIAHYVSVHGYLPPQAFVDAVVLTGGVQ